MKTTKSNPRVLIIGSSGNIGGAEKMIYTLVKEQKNVQYEVAFLYDSGYYGEKLSEEAQVYTLNFQKEKFKAIQRLYSLLKPRRYDIIYCWGLTVNILVRVIAGLIGYKKIIAAQRGVDNWRSKWHSMLDRMTSGFVSLYISNSEAGRQILIQREGIREDKVITIHNGIDLAPYHREFNREKIREDLKIPAENIVVTMVANLRIIKGHTYFLKALHPLTFPKEKITVLLIGAGELVEELQMYVATSNLNVDIRFLGKRTDVPDLLAISDIFVLSSLSEGLPNSVMEAMASKLPIIATDVGGVRELVIDGESGFVVPPKDVSLMAKYLDVLLKDSNLRHTMGLNGFAQINKDFSIDKMVSNTEETYFQLMNS